MSTFARLLPLIATGIVTAWAAPDGDGRCSEALAAEDQSLAFVQLGLSRAPKEAAQENWYPGRAVDANRSGLSKAIGPFPLLEPAWQFEVPGLNFHQTPCIDHMLNVYTGSDAGRVFSFDKFGVKRWEVQAGSHSCQNPFLLQGVLYTSCTDGEAIAYEMDTGKELWRSKVSDGLPGDTYSMGATDDYLFMPAGTMPGDIPIGSPEVVLLNRADGSVRWRYSVLLKHLSLTINLAGCHFEDSVVFSDVNGGVYRLSVKDGSEIWYQPGETADSTTLGGVSCGPDGKVYNGYASGGKGGVQALDINTGRRLWVKHYPDEIHNAPAVGKIYGYDKPAVIFGMGKPSGSQDPTSVNGTVFAADAETGETIWTFEPQIWHHERCAGFTEEQPCLPDLFSGATIGADGTVYINWSAGGITYALRELNGDGRCDLEDAMEVSGYDIASGATGPPAIAPGMLFVNTCRRLTAFIVE